MQGIVFSINNVYEVHVWTMWVRIIYISVVWIIDIFSNLFMNIGYIDICFPFY